MYLAGGATGIPHINFKRSETDALSFILSRGQFPTYTTSLCCDHQQKSRTNYAPHESLSTVTRFLTWNNHMLRSFAFPLLPISKYYKNVAETMEVAHKYKRDDREPNFLCNMASAIIIPSTLNTNNGREKTKSKWIKYYDRCSSSSSSVFYQVIHGEAEKTGFHGSS